MTELKKVSTVIAKAISNEAQEVMLSAWLYGQGRADIETIPATTFDHSSLYEAIKEGKSLEQIVSEGIEKASFLATFGALDPGCKTDYQDAKATAYKAIIAAQKERLAGYNAEQLKEAAEIIEYYEGLLSNKGVEAYEGADGLIDAFFGEIDAKANTPCISTGFNNLDTALDGGLYEGLYILGAMSSLGKTTFCLQVADHIAEAGKDVLIFSLEMSKYELIAKSISRLTYIEGGEYLAKTTRDITAGSRYKNYSVDEMALIAKAVEKYRAYSKHIYIIEGLGNVGIEEIKDAIIRHRNRTGRTPVIVLDYLQILAPSDVRATDKQNIDKAVLELKRISRDYKTPVVAISSFNRDTYKDNTIKPVGMAAFKESGGIEYSADVLIGFEFRTETGNENRTIDEAKADNPRQIDAKILKNRNGETGISIEYDYNPKFNTFKEKPGALKSVAKVYAEKNRKNKKEYNGGVEFR